MSKATASHFKLPQAILKMWQAMKYICQNIPQAKFNNYSKIKLIQIEMHPDNSFHLSAKLV